MLYFIRYSQRNAVKIGYSASPAERLRGLQTSSPDKLTLLGICPGGREEESALHRRLGHLRLRGEWFLDTPELQAVAKEMCAGHSQYGRCPRCGAVWKDLHDYPSGHGLACDDCDPPGPPRTLRRVRNGISGKASKYPAGGGYRILRKNV